MPDLRDWYARTPGAPDAARARLASALRADRASLGRARRGRGLALALAAVAVLMVGVALTRDGAEERAAGYRLAVRVPAATRVSLVGDFNDWRADATPMVRDPRSDEWVTTVALPPGRHGYAFVVDGARWVVDSLAPMSGSADFGLTNSLLVPAGS